MGFACQICNRILVMLLGFVGAVAYVERARYAVWLIGLAVMAYARSEARAKPFKPAKPKPMP